MWTHIVTTLVVLILATYVIQLLLPRTRGGANRTTVRGDVAPVVGFLGVILLALAFAEAARRALLHAWLVGIVGGLLVGAFVWLALGTRADLRPSRNGSALRATIRIVRVFGVPTLIGLCLLALAARFLGAVVEVFSAGLVGALVCAMAVWLFLVSPRIKQGEWK